MRSWDWCERATPAGLAPASAAPQSHTPTGKCASTRGPGPPAKPASTRPARLLTTFLLPAPGGTALSPVRPHPARQHPVRRRRQRRVPRVPRARPPQPVDLRRQLLDPTFLPSQPLLPLGDPGPQLFDQPRPRHHESNQLLTRHLLRRRHPTTSPHAPDPMRHTSANSRTRNERQPLTATSTMKLNVYDGPWCGSWPSGRRWQSWPGRVRSPERGGGGRRSRPGCGSTTHRFGSGWKPFCPSFFRTISTVVFMTVAAQVTNRPANPPYARTTTRPPSRSTALGRPRTCPPPDRTEVVEEREQAVRWPVALGLRLSDAKTRVRQDCSRPSRHAPVKAVLSYVVHEQEPAAGGGEVVVDQQLAGAVAVLTVRSFGR